MKKTILALAFTALTALSAQAADKLVIGTEGAYPPFNFVSADGKVGGFDVEIGMALCAEMKVECEVVTQDWDGIIPALQAKKFDFMIASMFITPERAEKVAFTKSYYKAPMTHIAQKGANITDFS
ncbi:MAG: transporter substrate-binding domain-containing protein, partial [Hydrogenophaga sp.]|nr:transporter substrate-binding domain-containing protein [Hydrogenophaga sp.]